MREWIIQDDFGNHCFPYQRFKSFQDGWNFLYWMYPQDEVDLDCYFVVEV